MPCDKSTWISDSSVHCETGLITKKPNSLKIEVQSLFQNATSRALVVKNPFFVPEAPPINTSISACMFSANVAPTLSTAFFEEYVFSGRNSNFTWADTSHIGSAFKFQEWTNVSVFVFINATQYYLDLSQKPIDKVIQVEFHLVLADGASYTHGFCRQPPRISMTLQRETFVVGENVSFTFCAASSVTVALVMTYRINDTDGTTVIKSASSAFFTLGIRGPMALVASGFPSVNISAFVGEYDGPSAKFTLNTETT
jgi:hypothetical protein